LEIESCFSSRQVWTVILQYYDSHHHWDDKRAPQHPNSFC
jgi:hypothetical protein